MENKSHHRKTLSEGHSPQRRWPTPQIVRTLNNVYDVTIRAAFFAHYL